METCIIVILSIYLIAYIIIEILAIIELIPFLSLLAMGIYFFYFIIRYSEDFEHVKVGEENKRIWHFILYVVINIGFLNFVDFNFSILKFVIPAFMSAVIMGLGILINRLLVIKIKGYYKNNKSLVGKDIENYYTEDFFKKNGSYYVFAVLNIIALFIASYSYNDLFFTPIITGILLIITLSSKIKALLLNEDEFKEYKEIENIFNKLYIDFADKKLFLPTYIVTNESTIVEFIKNNKEEENVEKIKNMLNQLKITYAQLALKESNFNKKKDIYYKNINEVLVEIIETINKLMEKENEKIEKEGSKIDEVLKKVNHNVEKLIDSTKMDLIKENI